MLAGKATDDTLKDTFGHKRHNLEDMGSNVLNAPPANLPRGGKAPKPGTSPTELCGSPAAQSLPYERRKAMYG